MADNARILVVDDDAGVRSVTGEMLRGMGFDVVTAEGGEQALDHYSTQRFDLILLDLSMPRLSGADVFRAVRGQDAAQRVIFMTGYARDDVAELLVDDSTDALAKPFPMRTLRLSVESMLNGSEGTSDRLS